MCKVTVWSMREGYAQTVLTFRTTYVTLVTLYGRFRVLTDGSDEDYRALYYSQHHTQRDRNLQN